MKLSKIIAMTVLLVGASSQTACVTQRRYDKVNQNLQAAEFQLDVAERALAKKDREISLLQKKHNARDGEIEAFRQQLSSAKKEVETVRDSIDNEYQQRFAELRATLPEAQVSAYGGIVLEDGVFFRPGRHELQTTGKASLEPVASKLGHSDFAGYTVEISGHTDSDPIRRTKSRYADNHILAANRANEVRRFLIARGIAPERLYITAWGAQRQLYEGAPKNKNRRVEIVLHKPETLANTVAAGAKRK